MTATYTTLADLVGQEIVLALNGVEPGFDTDALVQAMRDADMIVYVTHEGASQDNGFQLVTDEDGQIPGFWELVEKFDVSDGDFSALRQEAGAHGDWSLVADCDAALAGDEDARLHCTQIINDNRRESR